MIENRRANALALTNAPHIFAGSACRGLSATSPSNGPHRLHQCERRSVYSKATLIERFGADANMVDLRLKLAAGCPKIAANKIMDSVRRLLSRPDRQMKNAPGILGMLID